MTTERTDTDEPVGARRPAQRIIGHLVLGVLSLFCVSPIYWLYATSLRSPGDVYELSVLPWPLSTGNYVDALGKIDLAGMLLNTGVVAVLSALGQLLIALFAAYAFAAWKFPFQRVLYLMFVGTWLVPFQATMLPNYVLLARLGLLETLAGVIIPTLCSALGVLLLREHLKSFPKELLDAARMDGRSSWSALWTVVVPALRPVLAALGILLAITAWNEYFWPAMVLQRSNAVVQLGLRSFLGTEGNEWGPLMATAGLTCLPVFVLYLVLQRHIVNAFVRSGLK
ncbi:carbohydrate ABC transporter permease [Saccharopolyspora shandongensis]|uniref:carbohydrate ABC transporter permease n=1 Tax=Saccharopolyspora shandongensis TaxID=418495 RepID=UPI003411CD6D